jgi:4-hydroxy-tetrahydrodipicolinate reductase
MEQTKIRVAVVGAAGRMGREVLRAVGSDPAFEVVAAIDRTEIGSRTRDLAGALAPDLVLEEHLEPALDRTKPDVTIEFSHQSVALDHARAATERNISFVFGMTGISEANLAQIRDLCVLNKTPGMYVPNFAIGAVLMMHFAEIAAKWLPDAEVIEFHHDRKEDAPSGTAMLTAEKIGNARVQAPTPLPKPLLKAEGARGGLVSAVPVHSVRLPGLLAHQEVIFGGPGETLTIRHDSLDRASFMQGVKLCAKTVRSLNGLVVGLDKILF